MKLCHEQPLSSTVDDNSVQYIHQTPFLFVKSKVQNNKTMAKRLEQKKNGNILVTRKEKKLWFKHFINNECHGIASDSKTSG